MSDVKILDAGDKLLFSGADADSVGAKLAYYVGRGSKVVSPLSQVGSAWVAACTPPLQSAADTTSTLDLAEILKAQQSAAAPREEPRSDGVCAVEKVGFKRMITGPTREAVQAMTERFLEYGAGILSGPEEVFGQWSAVCDVGDERKKGG
ncbi:MAG TPA: hypothetical protein VFB08_19760 [Burkholderiales bacterium]|nr:hypothetical protein [Burkholderiales bacterium]